MIKLVSIETFYNNTFYNNWNILQKNIEGNLLNPFITIFQQLNVFFLHLYSKKKEVQCYLISVNLFLSCMVFFFNFSALIFFFLLNWKNANLNIFLIKFILSKYRLVLKKYRIKFNDSKIGFCLKTFITFYKNWNIDYMAIISEFRHFSINFIFSDKRGS